ncbi:MarR family winged helix-turn-helix transcriptional regulator [Acetobacterium tundrae]|nr:MarR family transcriptional regulator [Acetobacterium tundrae]
MQQNDEIGFFIKLISECLQKKANQTLKEFDLTLSQARILFYLHDRNETQTSLKDLEDFFEVTHPTIIGILNRLEGKDFVRNEHNSKDKRLKTIFLTEKGINLFFTMDHFRKTTERKMMQGLTSDQITELQSLLTTVYKNIQEI